MAKIHVEGAVSTLKFSAQKTLRVCSDDGVSNAEILLLNTRGISVGTAAKISGGLHCGFQWGSSASHLSGADSAPRIDRTILGFLTEFSLN